MRQSKSFHVTGNLARFKLHTSTVLAYPNWNLTPRHSWLIWKRGPDVIKIFAKNCSWKSQLLIDFAIAMFYKLKIISVVIVINKFLLEIKISPIENKFVPTRRWTWRKMQSKNSFKHKFISLWLLNWPIFVALVWVFQISTRKLYGIDQTGRIISRKFESGTIDGSDKERERERERERGDVRLRLVSSFPKQMFAESKSGHRDRRNKKSNLLKGWKAQTNDRHSGIQTVYRQTMRKTFYNNCRWDL